MGQEPVVHAYFAPGACSRVMLHALEEAGLAFEGHPLALMRGEQKSPEYLAINPKGKVPALVVDGDLLTENGAIAWYLANRFPEAGMLPGLDDPVTAAQALGDLIWCGGTLHPIVRRMMRPALFNESDPDGTRALAAAELGVTARDLDARLEGQDWWYGDTWSLVDTYVAWAFSIAAICGFPLSEYPNLASHTKRLSEKETFKRVVAREKEAVATHDIPLPPGASL
ncbi:glutathione S-transferase family protein [Novosphingobium album (ex Hu et al. 2023)]|uniref:Glutathione S-transferase family protein n=1 Tax=Novosphingobium album (ex Hu et al. 2023) TaxID=2930093 RepID=A0ABT0B761_9SPHN|nr:glutathione S-transferase family protein [Novosphingobium album (ex Hu et al. 2023)]MCJ2180744.1 glutathione S-transferase family protein [Novosphingobium album (ex Hu et al. 2023)]